MDDLYGMESVNVVGLAPVQAHSPRQKHYLYAPTRDSTLPFCRSHSGMEVLLVPAHYPGQSTMSFQRYSQRLLNPFRGVVNCIRYRSAEAVTADGVRWDIYVSNEALLEDTELEDYL